MNSYKLDCKFPGIAKKKNPEKMFMPVKPELLTSNTVQDIW